MTTCPECGSSLASGLADGLCPACLLSGLDAFDEHFSEAIHLVPSPGNQFQVPGYTIAGEIARGGMGIVYRARQHIPDREVALKMLLPFSATSEELRARFLQEAQTLAELDHPAILPIHEMGERDGFPWFAMKLASGGSLSDRVSQYTEQWRQIAGLLVTLAEAVQYAHGHGVLHRDLKPGNILFDSATRPFIADFGLAKLIHRDRDFTQTRGMLGTPHYLAPEVADGSARKATIESDVYSLGAILFELLVGRPPFQAESLPALLRQIVEEEPRFPSTAMAQDYPTDLKVIALKCLAKNPANRYRSAQALADELRRYLANEPILARPAGPIEKLWRWVRRKPALASAIIACALIFFLGVAGILWQLRETEAARSEAIQKARDEETQRISAEEARLLAQQSERVMRQNLYAADMLGAQRALEQNDLGGARLLLNSHRPANGQPDLRGFEWRYFWGQTRSDDFLTLTNKGHEISTLTFSPKGEFLAFGSRQVLLYNTTDYQLVAKADTPHIQSVAFLPATHHLILGSRAREVWLWDWKQTNQPIVLFQSGRWPNVAVSPKTHPGVLAAGFGASITGRTDGRTTLYYSEPYDESGNKWQLLPDSGGIVAFSPDGQTVATGSWQDTIKLWKSANGHLVKTLTNATRIASLSFSPDGKTLAACSFDAGAWLFDIATGAQQPFARGHTASVLDAEFSPDGLTLATAGADQTVRLWDLQTGQQKKVFRGHSYTVSHVAWSPDGKTLASGGQDGTVRLWKIQQAQSQDQSLPGQVERRNFSPDGKVVTFFSPSEGVTLRVMPELQILSGPRQIGFPLGIPTGGQTLFTLQQPSNQLAQIHCWALPDLTLLSQTTLSESTNTLLRPTLSPDGNWFAAGVGRGRVGLWNLSGNSNRVQLQVPAPQTALINALTFSPNSQRLAASFMDSIVIHTWDLTRNSATPQYRELGQHPGFILQLNFSADGRELMSADSDKFIRIWDIESGHQRANLLGHRQGILAMDLSPDGRTLASSSTDRTLRLWNLATHREVGRFELDTEATSLTFAPDSSALFITKQDKTKTTPITFIWRAPSLVETDPPPHSNP